MDSRLLPSALALPLLFPAVLFAAMANARDNLSNPPNVLLILVDDLGYGDLSCYGASDLQTPQLDRLISRGCGFRHSMPTVRSARPPGRRF